MRVNVTHSKFVVASLSKSRKKRTPGFPRTQETEILDTNALISSSICSFAVILNH